MSQRIGQLFQKTGTDTECILYGRLSEKESLMDVLRALNEFGADLIEIECPIAIPC
jgi:hypothetical protein